MKILIFILLSYFNSNYALKPSSGCGKTQPFDPNPGHYKQFYFNYTDHRLGAIERNFIIQVPLDYTHVDPTPLVFDMHGFQGDASIHMSKSSPF